MQKIYINNIDLTYKLESLQMEYNSYTQTTTFIVIQKDMIVFNEVHNVITNNTNFIVKVVDEETGKSIEYSINEQSDRIDLITSNNTIILKG